MDKKQNSPAHEADEILTEVEAQKFLRLSRMSLIRNRQAGRLGFFRLGGGRVAYSLQRHLLPFLASCEQPARKERPLSHRKAGRKNRKGPRHYAEISSRLVPLLRVLWWVVRGLFWLYELVMRH